MADQGDELRRTLEDVAGRLHRLEERVAALETADSRRREAEAAEEGSAVERPLPGAPLALLGRTLLVLAGAYLFRAATESGLLPLASGVAIGLGYAVFWQLLAGREARRGRRQSAAFHALAGSVIAFPLVWEAAARFDLVPAPSAQALVVGLFAVGLAVALRYRLVVDLVLTTSLAVVTTVALLAFCHDLLAALVGLLAIAVALDGLAGRAGGTGTGAAAALRWPAFLVLDGVALLSVMVTSRAELAQRYSDVSPLAVTSTLLALPVLSLVAVTWRTLRGRRLAAFDVAQGSLGLAIGFPGAWRVASAAGLGATIPIAAALALGALSYAVAFRLAERRPGSGGSFYFCSSVALLLTLGGTAALGATTAVPLAWAALGVGFALLGRRYDRMTLRVHGALCLVVAAARTGLLLAAAAALGGGHPSSLPPAAWGVALAAGVAWVLLAQDRRTPGTGPRRLPHLLMALLAVLGLGKALQGGLWSLLAARLTADAGLAAVARTALLAALVLLLAAAARRGELPELGWLAYGLLALGGLKLVTQDLREGRPVTLFASLALYGSALMLAPRLIRLSRGERPPDADE